MINTNVSQGQSLLSQLPCLAFLSHDWCCQLCVNGNMFDTEYWTSFIEQNPQLLITTADTEGTPAPP